MEPITTWSQEKVSEWLRGLEAPLQQYSLQDWQLSGQQLLTLSCKELEQMGMWKIGHQELVLAAIEKLCSLTYSTAGESLRSMTEKLRSVAHSLQMSTQGRWRVNTYSGQSSTKLPAGTLQSILEVIMAAKGLFSVLNRYHFTELSGYVGSTQIITHCQELGAVVQKDVTVYEKEKDIISICRHLVAICDDIVSSSPESLLNHTSQLESVQLVPVSPGDHLGIEIISTVSGGHYITGTVTESPAEFSEDILVGDEVIQVNDQIVVGWSRANLVRKLQENPSGVSLVLKKVPLSKQRQKSVEPGVPQGENEEKVKSSLLGRVTASVRSLSFRVAVQGGDKHPPMGQEESEPVLDNTHPDSQAPSFNPSYKGQVTITRQEQEDAVPESSPRTGRASVSSCPEMGGPREEKEVRKNSTKGTRTAMSRRRVSCRELGRPDYDGWLWKKKKESAVFLSQKWQRFWFVLKGPSLYWYSSQQEEKAVGLVKIGSYRIESAGEHKRKYVFKMCHERFQTFIFAAENVSDMSKWINCLITAIQKCSKLHKNPPDSEEECYSETEPEDEGSHSPHSQRNKANAGNTLPRAKAKKTKEAVLSPGFSPTSGTSRSAGPAEDEMGVLFHQLKEGGVSLIGREQPLTQDHFRRSFIRRNKNPIINEKAHALRALQSTLKAKEAELQVINKVLEDSHLTSAKFRQWKDCNEELFQEIERLAMERAQQLPKSQAGTQEVAPATGAAGDGSCGVRLSDGEQLVDEEESGIGSTGSAGEASAHAGAGGNVDPDSFFI